MKRIQYLILAAFMGVVTSAMAQTTMNPADFHGAKATKSHYQAVYQLNTDDEPRIKGTLRNIQNLLDDPRLKGKVAVELVVHGGGVAAYKKGSATEEALRNLQKQGVILAMCENTMRERKISRDELFPFLSYVPSGNGELVIRQQEGWAVIHP